MSVTNFLTMQNIYRSNVFMMFKNIWLRGAVTIIKKFKFLRRYEQRRGKWGFTGHRDMYSLKILEEIE